MIQDEEKYRETFHVRRVERCCGTCRHFERDYEDSGCAHPKQREFDPYGYEYKHYGAFSGITVDEGCICDLWEEKEE